MLNNLLFRKIKNILPSVLFLKWQYYIKTGLRLDLNNPRGLDQKIQWLKIHYRNNLMGKLVDKYLVREYIKKKIGPQYLNKLYGVYQSVDEIIFEDLPKEFVLKCTHGSAMNIICRDKSTLDLKKVKKIVNKWLRTNWYQFGREWAYKNVKRRIICEKFLKDKNGNPPFDYKFYCFHGEPKLIEFEINGEKQYRNFYSIPWKQIPAIDKGVPNTKHTIDPPVNLNEMFKIVKVLSGNFPFVRVDLYSIDHRIYFGELTFYPGRGLERFEPDKYEYIYGDYLKIELINKERN